jgi:secreted trypsin-like serine protease
MKVLFVALALVAVVSAIPNGRRLRPEEHWRPAQARDLSKYKPKPMPTGAKDSSIKINARPKKTPTPKVSVYNLAEECGIEGPPAIDRIVGGDEAAENQWPWIVALFIDDAWFCGGSLISENWVMTAAHCVEDALYFDILAGAHNVRESNEPHRVEITSFNGFTHEDWDHNTLANDIALIELPEPITFNDYIKPSCLPTAGHSCDVGEMVSVIGWGKPSDSANSISPTLQMVHDIPVMSNAECNDYYGIIGDGIVCIDTTGGRGSCNGDSGGPLIEKGELKEAGQKWTQVGVVSFGSSRGCEVGAPAGFTRTEYYLDWIMGNSGIKY